MLRGYHSEYGMLAHQLCSNWAADVHMFSLHENCVAEHRGSSHVTQEELTDGVSFITQVGILSHILVNVENGDAENCDAAKHDAKGPKDIEECINSVS